MNPDRRISRNFVLSEFSGWQTATAGEILRLEEFVHSVLQPIRDRWGVIIPTSWRTWSSGEPRTGAHAQGAVDFVPAEAPMMDVHMWAAYNLRGRYGEIIDERDHIHVTPPGVGGDGEVLVEYREGEYAAVDPTAARWRLPDGTVYELPGIVATVAGPRTWLGIVLAAGLLLEMGRRS